MLLILIYVFSIVFRSQVRSQGGNLEVIRFPSVMHSMRTLLFHGTFLDSVSLLADEITAESGSFLFCVFVLYICTTSILMLNMLIGVVCEMVSMVKQEEDDRSAKAKLRSQLLDILTVYDADGCGALKEKEFELFMGNVEVMQVLKHYNVDVNGLRTLTEGMFSHASLKGHAEEKPSVNYDEIMELAVRLKGDSASRVEDIVQLREFTKQRLEMLEEHLISGQRLLEQHISTQLMEQDQDDSPRAGSVKSQKSLY